MERRFAVERRFPPLLNCSSNENSIRLRWLLDQRDRELKEWSIQAARTRRINHFECGTGAASGIREFTLRKRWRMKKEMIITAQTEIRNKKKSE